MDDGSSGLVLDAELPLSSLAGRLRMAEAELCRRALDLVKRVLDAAAAEAGNAAPPRDAGPTDH